MGKQKEGSLQERIQNLVKKRGGYCKKNWGSMISEPGVPDITVGYKGIHITIEVKVDENNPTRQQGIHCRNLWKAGNIAFVTWDTFTVNEILEHVDWCIDNNYSLRDLILEIKAFILEYKIDDGTKW